jgi:hypothetical protein
MITFINVQATIKVDGHKFLVSYISDDICGPEINVSPETIQDENWYGSSDLNYLKVHLEAAKVLKSDLFIQHYEAELLRCEE